jgi:hypothetical protein
LNGDAAALMMRDRPAYEQKVKGKQITHCLFNTFIATCLEIT